MTERPPLRRRPFAILIVFNYQQRVYNAQGTIDEKLTDVMDSKQAAFDAFADKSDVAREDFELNAATIDAIIKEEAERIKAKQGLPAPQEETASEAIETEEGDTAEDRNETDDA